MRSLYRRLPERWRLVAYNARQSLRGAVARLTWRGQRHYCPCCQANLKAWRFGTVNAPTNARCPVCSVLERHRLLHLYLTHRTNLLDGRPKRVLHIAPEKPLEKLIRGAPGVDYLSADLFNPAMVRMDITDIQYPDNSFDVILCTHVLEHVPDDRQAMRELRRVLKPDGWAVLQVPITSDHIIEDPGITDPRERERLFGRPDHVRRYGPDYMDRLREEGWHVTPDDYLAQLDAETRDRYGLPGGFRIFLCHKTPRATSPPAPAHVASL